MLTQVTIRNYRGFESYKLEGLSRVNLLVGKNNSGKTAILEGVQLLTSGGDPSVIFEAAQRRGEMLAPSGDPPMNMLVDIAHFFRGHSLEPDADFVIGGDSGYSPITVKIQARKNGDKVSKESGGKSSPFVFVIESQAKKDEVLKLSISRDGGIDFEIPRFYRRPGTNRSSASEVRFVGSDSLHYVELAPMWDAITLAGQEADVVEALRVLEPTLVSVHFLTGMRAAGFYPTRGGVVVGFVGQEGRLPLGSMGDGMRRMMTLALALAFTKNGCLLVDEIDTGLHYSVMADMWKLILSRAIATGTQVLATTHSWDCIEGLSRLCELFPDFRSQVAIHKIDPAIPRSIPFDGEDIVRMCKADIDPR